MVSGEEGGQHGATGATKEPSTLALQTIMYCIQCIAMPGQMIGSHSKRNKRKSRICSNTFLSKDFQQVFINLSGSSLHSSIYLMGGNRKAN